MTRRRTIFTNRPVRYLHHLVMTYGIGAFDWALAIMVFTPASGAITRINPGYVETLRHRISTFATWPRLRDCVRANTARGAAHFLRETAGAPRRGHGTTTPCGPTAVSTLMGWYPSSRKTKVRFSITIRRACQPAQSHRGHTRWMPGRPSPIGWTERRRCGRDRLHCPTIRTSKPYAAAGAAHRPAGEAARPESQLAYFISAVLDQLDLTASSPTGTKRTPWIWRPTLSPPRR